MTESIDTEIACEKMYSLISQCRCILCEDAINEVVHYVDHNEPEIGFEGLFIELMQVSSSIPISLDREACIDLGEYLNLDIESVLDDNFWEKFLIFINK